MAKKAADMSIWIPVVTAVLSVFSAFGVGYLTLVTSREQSRSAFAASHEQVLVEQQKLEAAETAAYRAAVKEIVPLLLDQSSKLKSQSAFALLLALYPDRAPDVVEAVRRGSSELEGSLTSQKGSALAAEAEAVARTVGDWAVIFGGHKTIEDATKYLQPATREYSGAAIYFREGSYRTIIGPFPTRIAAESANIAVRARYRDDAYVVNLGRWCPGPVDKGNYVDCQSLSTLSGTPK